MDSNVVYIGSTDIISLGFLAYFDLDQQKLLLDITGQTVFNTGGESNVFGIGFNITGPGGIPLATLDFNAPQIIPADSSTFELDLPGGYGMFGFYSIQCFIKDADAKVYNTALITKEISQPFGYAKGSVPGDVFIEADCDVPQLLITENTKTAYRSFPPIERVVSGTLSYPAGTLEDLAFTTTPFIIAGAGLVYTGRYTINNKTICMYDLKEGIRVKIPYVVKGYEKVVDNNTGLYEVLCCVEEVKSIYDRNPLSAQGKSAKEKLDNITIPFYMAILKEKSGQDAKEEIDQIKKELNCDCCGTSAIEARPLLGVGLTGVIINVTGTNAAAVTSSISGSTKTFAINVKNVLLQKDPSDLGFSIIRTEASNQIVYTIGFNYTEMAANILFAIQNDNDLTQLLKNIVAVANAGISLDGVNSSCVITLNNCNYELIESVIPTKGINSIKIGDTVYNAPDGLLLTDTTGIVTWLNGLSLGTFSATYDSGSSTVLIQSLSNANVITLFAMSIGAVNITRQFTRTCIGLVDMLNAITTYICTIDTTKMKFGVDGQVVNFFNEDGSVGETALDPATALSTILTEMLAAQTILFNAITNISLTCAHAKALFQPSTASLVDGDGLYGLRNNACASYTWKQIAQTVLDQIGADSGLKSAFCALVSACAAGSTCAVVTSLSAVFDTTVVDAVTVGRLTINCNDADPSTSLQARYRIFGSGDTYTVVDFVSGDLPLVITGVPMAQFEVGVRKLCTNGTYSSWAVANTAGCAIPIGFSVVISGSDFAVTGSLAGSQTKIEVKMTDPNGGISSVVHDFGGSSGTFNIPIPNPTLYGNYTFQARGVCNDTSVPRYVSNYLSPAVVNNPDPDPGPGSVMLQPVIISNDTEIGEVHFRFSLAEALSADLGITYGITYMQGGSPHTPVVSASTTILHGNTDGDDLNFVYAPGVDPTTVQFTYTPSPNPNGGTTVVYTSPQSLGL